MEIIALKQYTDRYISLYQGEIRNIGNNLATKLIEQGIVAEHDEIGSEEGNSSGSSGGAFIVEITDQQLSQDEESIPIFILSATWNEIQEAILAGKNVYLQEPVSSSLLALNGITESEDEGYGIMFFNLTFTSSSKNSNNYSTIYGGGK